MPPKGRKKKEKPDQAAAAGKQQEAPKSGNAPEAARKANMGNDHFEKVNFKEKDLNYKVDQEGNVYLAKVKLPGQVTVVSRGEFRMLLHSEHMKKVLADFGINVEMPQLQVDKFRPGVDLTLNLNIRERSNSKEAPGQMSVEELEGYIDKMVESAILDRKWFYCAYKNLLISPFRFQELRKEEGFEFEITEWELTDIWDKVIELQSQHSELDAVIDDLIKDADEAKKLMEKEEKAILKRREKEEKEKAKAKKKAGKKKDPPADPGADPDPDLHPDADDFGDET